MKLKLTRKNNENCYMYGSIWNDKEYVCDTLEFGSGCQLPAGLYYLRLQKNIQLNYIEIIINSQITECTAKLVKDNCYMYKNIKMRYENSNICIGTKILEPLLVMNNYVYHSLSVMIAGCQNAGEKIELEIIDIIN